MGNREAIEAKNDFERLRKRRTRRKKRGKKEENERKWKKMKEKKNMKEHERKGKKRKEHEKKRMEKWMKNERKWKMKENDRKMEEHERTWKGRAAREGTASDLRGTWIWRREISVYRTEMKNKKKRVYVVWLVCTSTWFSLVFLHVMVVVPLTFHNVSFFCFSLQFQALFHVLSNVNMWKIAWNCFEMQETIHTLRKVNGLFCDTASSPSLHLHSC